VSAIKRAVPDREENLVAAPVRVTVWNEYTKRQREDPVVGVYQDLREPHGHQLQPALA
jgi:hypothetical protein